MHSRIACSLITPRYRANNSTINLNSENSCCRYLLWEPKERRVILNVASFVQNRPKGAPAALATSADMASTDTWDLKTFMDMKTLDRRAKLMKQDGIHLTYSVPRPETDLQRATYIKPIPGLCIVFLVYQKFPNASFCGTVGGKKYTIGYVHDHPTWGLYSLTYNSAKNNWRGYNKKDYDGFKSGSQYHYVYIYFKDHNTMNVSKNLPANANWLSEKGKSSHIFRLRHIRNKSAGWVSRSLG